MTFAVDDRVVHPQHGVGRVVRLASRRFDAGTPRLYYEIALVKGTIWVPVADSLSGLRRLTGSHELARCRSLLRGRPSRLAEDHRQRQLEVTHRLKAGTLRVRCEVVRDLTAHGWGKPLCQSSAALLHTASEALNEEWAAAEGTSVHDAAREIAGLLLEGRRVFEPKPA
jgi:RNA polymerase-interacting CarD/CdnL/TRCF family regulator